MNRVKDFIKKYHVLPYAVAVILIVIVAYIVKWYNYGKVYHILGEEAGVVYNYFNVILLIIISGFTLLYAMVVTKASIEKIYLAAGITGAVLFMLIVTPFAAADENRHTYECYDLSNVLFGYAIPKDEKSHWLRECDGNTGLTREICIENYYYTAKNLFTTAESETMILYRIDDITYSTKNVIYYFPAVLGLSVGRLLGLSDVAVFMLGRLFTMAACIAINYFALKKMPFFKVGFALVLLMPSVISRMAAITYDGLLMSYVFLFVSYVMYYVKNKATIKLKDAIIMIIAGIAFSVGKGGAYIPFLLLLFLIPRENFGSKIKYPLIVAGSIFICLVSYCLFNVSLFMDVAESTQGSSNDLLWTEEDGYTLKYIISNPVESVKLLIRTIISCGDVWYGQMICNGFGWLQIYVPSFLTLAYTVLFVLSGLNINGEEFSIDKKSKCIFAGVALLSSAMVILSMWIFWTPLNYGTIAGVQGRYFIPICMLLVLMLKNKKLIIKKDISKLLIIGAYVILVMACLYIWMEC